MALRATLFSLRLRVVLAACLFSSAAGATNVLTQHNDNARTGANLAEKVLTTSNVRTGAFGKLFTRPVDGALYAQPLVVDGLVIVATMHNTVFAYDVDAKVMAPVWRRTLEPSITLPDPNIGASCGVYSDIAAEVGIVSTPVIDPVRRLLYVVTATRTGSGVGVSYAHWIHALDLATGVERLGGPRRIEATITVAGAGAGGAGNVVLESNYQVQRASLLLANDTVYVAFAAYCDSRPYHGWLLGYDAKTLILRAIFNSTPNGGEGGIWQAGQGPAADSAGNVFVVTGNGTASMQNGGSGLGSAIVALSPTLDVTDWFIAHDFKDLNDADLDLGSTGTLLVPDTTLAVAAAKSGRIYVVDRNALGHFRADDDGQIVQTIEASSTGRIYGSPVFWRGPTGALVYLQTELEALKAYRVADGILNGPVANGSTSFSSGMPGGVLSVSADGAAAGTGIVWASVSSGLSANNRVVPGVLRAYDAADISREIWDSTMETSDAVGSLAKFAPPTIADGRVYVSTFSGELAVYGLRAELSVDGGAPDSGEAPPSDVDAAVPPAFDDAGARRPPSMPSARGSGCDLGGTAGGAGALLVGGALVMSVLRRRRARGSGQRSA